MSLFHITVTDKNGDRKTIRIHAMNLLEAGMVAEELYEQSLEKKKDEKEGD